MSTAVLFDSYPFYARPALTPSLVALAQLKAPLDRDLGVPLALIEAVENHKAVQKNGDGTFVIDPALLAKAVPDQQAQLNILHAVFRANSEVSETQEAPKIAAATTAAAGAAAPPNPITIITQILGDLPSLPQIQADLTALAKGAKVVERHWWGIQLALTKDGATALADLVGTQLAALPAVMAALSAIPALAVLGAIAGIFTALLKLVSNWISQANSGPNGVLLTMVLWFLPVPKASPTPVIVP